MPSVYRRRGFPNYYAAFYDAAGKRVYRSTGTARRVDAVRRAAELEAASRRAGDGEEDVRRVLAIVEEAGDRAIRGRLSVSVARELINRMLEVSGSGPVYEPSVEKWFKDWLGGKRGAKAEGTWLRYKGVVDAFLDSLPKSRREAPLNSLTIDEIRRFRDRLTREGRSAATANVALKTLRSPLNAARKQGIINHNPAEAVELLAQRAVEVDVFTPEQVAAMAAAASPAWCGMILGGYYTGARIGDLANLKWAAVDVEGGMIRFRQGKTGRVVEVPVHPEFSAWLKTTPKSKRKGAVFPKFAGKTSAGTNGLSGQFRRVMVAAGIEGKTTEKSGEKGRNRSSLTFHSLRHSFNSAMANAGVAQEVRQRLTGHASKAVNDRYTHAELETLRNAVRSVPGLPSTAEAQARSDSSPGGGRGSKR